MAGNVITVGAKIELTRLNARKKTEYRRNESILQQSP